MQRIPVKSSNIKSIGWSTDGGDESTGTLHVEFIAKKESEEPRLYEYAAVPYDKYRQFLNAPSVGSHFAAFIRNNYQSHRIDAKKEEPSVETDREGT